MNQNYQLFVLSSDQRIKSSLIILKVKLHTVLNTKRTSEKIVLIIIAHEDYQTISYNTYLKHYNKINKYVFIFFF